MKLMRRQWKMKEIHKLIEFSRSFSSTNHHLNAPVNAFGVPLITPKLHKKIFGTEQIIKDAKSKEFQAALQHLAKFKIKPSSSSDPQNLSEEKDFSEILPELHGNNVETHFYEIASQQNKPYLDACIKLQNAKIPQFPKKWIFQKGWTKYDENGNGVPVEYPMDEDAVVFDIENCVDEGPWPVMAAAVSSKSWYSWCSPFLIDTTQKPSYVYGYRHEDFIPMGNPLLVIGHNVSYDRARIGDQYSLNLSQTRFLDTMALHIAIGGMTSNQRLFKIARKSENATPLAHARPKWLNETSMNGLHDVHQLYMPREKRLTKDVRDVFVKGTLQDVVSDFQNLMDYCAGDVKATLQVFQKMFPVFLERCPHPVTLSGMLTMSTSYLPVNQSWFQYIDESDKVAEELDSEVDQLILKQAQEVCQLCHDQKYEDDVWLWDLDWSIADLKIKKGKKTKKQQESSTFPEDIQVTSELEKLDKQFYSLLCESEYMYKTQPRCPGYPKWFSDLCSVYEPVKTPKPESLSYGLAVVPKLLRLTWMGFPLYRDQHHKWGYLKPDEKIEIVKEMYDEGMLEETNFPLETYYSMMKKSSKIAVQSEDMDIFKTLQNQPKDYISSEKFPKNKNDKKKKPKSMSEAGLELKELTGCIFYKLPHKNGEGLSVGNPLAKSFLEKIESGVLSTYTEGSNLAEKVLKISKMVSYWKSSHDRIRNQVVVKSSDESRAILPQIVTAGTLTRRAVEKTWLTASNAKKDRVGSELKAMVMAPDGYTLVGADVDSQELWISAVIGDANFTGEHGSTALGWMTLQGKKSEGTDMHSMTAKTAGVTRDEAKILNYGRIYGAGNKFASQLLQNFNPKLTKAEALTRANDMYSETKGNRGFLLNKMGALCYYLRYQVDDEMDYQKFINLSIGKAEMSQCINERRKLKNFLEPYFQLRLENLVLNDHGIQIADDHGIKYDTDGAITIKELKKFCYEIGYMKVDFEKSSEEFFELRTQLHDRSVWKDGSESHTFNKLEDIVLNFNPKTPVLGCAISKALESDKVGNDFIPSRINWVVQSSAVDYLHLLLTSMDWLIQKYNIEGRFLISIHDEVRYLVKEEDKYRAALALEISNLLVRAIFCSRLGMNSMPKDIAFFSGLDIDKVMRKEPGADSVTPSNPQGLFQGYGIPFGECLTIDELIEKTNGGKLFRYN